MSRDYLVATNGLYARRAITELRYRAHLHEPYEAYDALKGLVRHLETIRFHNEDAFIAAMDNVISVLNTRRAPL